MTWEHGRELATISNGSTTWTNTYNADGLRTKRTNGTKTYEYIYSGGQLTQMTVGSDVLRFGYDANGSPMYLQFNNSRYFYATNLQGDVMALVHTSGTAVVEYTYDAWGNILSTTGSMASTLGQINPLRYRGYVYDAETELYYLQSRYYDPELGRFINADAFTSTGQSVLGNNMFTYCLNNPVRYIDTTGSAAEDATEPKENDEENYPLRWVGFGIQGELDYSTYSVGIEIIIYWDVEECAEDTWVIALYLYDGRSVDMSDPLLGSVLANLANNIHLLQDGSDESLDSLIKIVQNGGSCSLSGVSLWGTEEFNSVHSYEGPFTSIYGNIGHVKGSFAYSSNCIAASLGRSWGINSRAWGFSRTNYNLLGYINVPSPVALFAD